MSHQLIAAPIIHVYHNSSLLIVAVSLCLGQWRVKGSVRVRVTHVGGDNRTAFRPDPIGGGTDALISALFFDA